MDTPHRRGRALHPLPEVRDQEFAPEHPHAQPRPGYGAVYLRKGRDLHWRVVWVATWIDEIPGHGTATAQVEGTRDTVLAWARS